MKEGKKTRIEKKGGVSIAPLTGHATYKWRVTYTEGGKRAQKYFRKKYGDDGAKAFAEDQRGKLKEEGAKHADISDKERRAIMKFREEVGKLPGQEADYTLDDAVKYFLDHVKLRHQSITCIDVADKLVTRLVSEGKSKRHTYTIENRLKRFNSEYGDWLACDVSTEVINDFLESLKVKAQTLRHYRSGLFQMFSYAMKLGAATVNPAAKAIKPKVVIEGPGILTPN